MGQILILQADYPSAADKLWPRAVALMREITGTSPTDGHVQPCLRAAQFPKHASASAGFHRDTFSGRWICGTGTWFYEGAFGRAALEHLVRDMGEDGPSDSILNGLDGQFAIVTARGDESGFSVITDRLGTLHIYSAEIDGSVVVCTSSLVLASLAQAPWDECSCREFLATGTVFEQRTLFRGIEKLRPATVTHFPVVGRRFARKYWDLKNYMFDQAARQGNVAELAGSLEAAVSTVVRAFPNAVFDLTGGFDSRGTVAAALRTGASIATVVNGPESSPDVQIANRIAREFALDHRHQQRESGCHWQLANRALPLCDGEYDLLEYSGTLSAHLALASHFEASVNGSNGEICKGYWWELLMPHIGAKGHFDSRMVAARRFLFEASGADLLQSGHEPSLMDHFTAVIEQANRGLNGYPNTALMDNIYLTLRMQRWQGRIASATSRIWPCISPFAFRPVMEAALSAPPRMRVRHRMTRRLIEHLNPRLAALPLAQGYPALPLRIGTAHRFWPLVIEGVAACKRRLPPPLASLSRSHSAAANAPAICRTSEFRDTMRPRHMKSAGLYDERRLTQFLAETQLPGFFAERQLGRILTLELVAQRVSAPVAQREAVLG